MNESNLKPDNQNNLSQTPEPQAVPPQNTLSKFNPKNPTILGGLVVTFLLLLSLVGYIFYKNNPQQDLTPVVPTPQISNEEPKEQTKKESGSISYESREKIFESIKIARSVTETNSEDFDIYIYDFFKVGTVTSGIYKDGELILALVTYDGPCKSSSCGKPLRFRYIKKGNAVTFLPKVSQPIKFIAADDSLTKTNPFQKFGLMLNTDNTYTIPELEYPETIVGAARQILNLPEYSMEEDGNVDFSKLTTSFNHPISGTVYTTKPELSPDKSFYTEGGGLTAKDSVTGCRNEGCFTTNAFFVFRPDGTFLKYSFKPDFAVKDIAWNNQPSSVGDYDYTTHVGCSYDTLDYNSVVSSTLVNDADLAVAGKVNTTGDTIYQLKNKDHRLYTEFYENYKKNFSEWYQYSGTDYQSKTSSTPKSYTEFLNSRPLFLWRDPFGRLIRFNNKDFLPALFCEPIIYLYPEKTEEINLHLRPEVKITASNPEYGTGWKVIADTSGKIINVEDDKAYPYLFWEGWSSTFPIQEEGFVIEQSKVEGFFKDVLPKLGLNNKEASDFMEAWMPRLNESPYYFITFIDKHIVDVLAPIEIYPKPDTIIRVLMDFKPLDKSITVQKLQLPETPQRHGFTVVEWGGLKR